MIKRRCECGFPASAATEPALAQALADHIAYLVQARQNPAPEPTPEGRIER